eukprot:4836387-Pleurochrysis_carterae.AAC.1
MIPYPNKQKTTERRHGYVVPGRLYPSSSAVGAIHTLLGAACPFSDAGTSVDSTFRALVSALFLLQFLVIVLQYSPGRVYGADLLSAFARRGAGYIISPVVRSKQFSPARARRANACMHACCCACLRCVTTAAPSPARPRRLRWTLSTPSPLPSRAKAPRCGSTLRQGGS